MSDSASTGPSGGSRGDSDPLGLKKAKPDLEGPDSFESQLNQLPKGDGGEDAAALGSIDEADDLIQKYMDDFFKRHQINTATSDDAGADEADVPNPSDNEAVGNRAKVDQTDVRVEDVDQVNVGQVEAVPVEYTPRERSGSSREIRRDDSTLSGPTPSDRIAREVRDDDSLLPFPSPSRQRTAPPESRDALQAMRQLANSNARGAIEIHANKQVIGRLYCLLAVGVLAIGSSVALVHMSTSTRSLAYWTGVMALCVGMFSCCRYLSLSRHLTVRPGSGGSSSRAVK